MKPGPKHFTLPDGGKLTSREALSVAAVIDAKGVDQPVRITVDDFDLYGALDLDTTQGFALTGIRVTQAFPVSDWSLPARVRLAVGDSGYVDAPLEFLAHQTLPLNVLMVLPDEVAQVSAPPNVKILLTAIAARTV